jgi:hypothetical protein
MSEKQEPTPTTPPVVVSAQAPDHELQPAEPNVHLLEHDVRALTGSAGAASVELNRDGDSD